MSARRALVVGHADDADLLERNLRHHLAIGIEHIIVSTIGEDQKAAHIVARFDPLNVFHRVVNAADEDAFVYFESAARWVCDHLSVDWIGFIDTDEFIVTATGRLEDAPGDDHYDMMVMRRYNARLERTDFGVIVTPNLDDLSGVPVVDAQTYTESAWASGDMTVPYIDAIDVNPKLFVRPYLIADILSGAHTVVTRAPYLVRSIDPSCVIVHIPFTTLRRFTRKVASIRLILDQYGHRFNASRWRHWASLPDEGLAAEFERQALGGVLLGGAEITTARTVIGRKQDVSHEWRLLSRAVAYDGSDPYARGSRSDVAGCLLDHLSYVTRYADLAAACRDDRAFDSAQHFRRYGIVEGRKPSYAFDTQRVQRYFERRFGGPVEPRDVWWLYFDQPEHERAVPNDWFDAAWFRSHGDRSSVRESDWTAFVSYLSRVAEQALSPNAWFDEAAYRRSCPAIAAAIERGDLTSGFQHFYLRAHAGDVMAGVTEA